MEINPVVVLTRERPDNQLLAKVLGERLVPVWEIPCVATRYREPDEIPTDLQAVIFTSRRGVKGLVYSAAGRHLVENGPRPLLAAVGRATAQALEQAGWHADLIADPPCGVALARMMIGRLAAGAHVAIVRGNLRVDGMDETLLGAGYVLHSLSVYENIEPEIAAFAPRQVAAVFVASPSAVHRLLAANGWLKQTKFVCIGPTTAEALKGKGVDCVITVSTEFVDWVEALCAAYASKVQKTVGCVDPRP